jgi:hypothetical protein
MEFLFKSGFYGLTSVSTLALALFFLGNLFSETGPNKLILLVSGLTGSAILAWAIHLGHVQSQYLAGMGLAGAAVLVFGTMMLIGIFTFTNVHWQ